MSQSGGSSNGSTYLAQPTPSAPTALHVHCDTFLFEFIHDCLAVGLSVISKLQVKIARTSLAEYVPPFRDLLTSYR